MTKFSDFDLANPVLKALDKEGYETPTPIQAQAIPLVMEGGDILGIAQTGTGKTAAFALPLLHHLCKLPDMPGPGAVRCLIIAPTRELASQIAEAFSKYGQCLSLRVLKVFGGVPIRKQMRDLHRGADVLVATPGRLIDLMEQGAVDLSFVEKLVLDEADQMLDLGFIHPLRRIANAVPEDRQTLFFSATMPSNVSGLANQFLTNPKKVSIAQESTTAERVDQSLTHVNQAQKGPLLLVKLQDETIDRALVFMRTKHGADKVVSRLMNAGIRCGAIHGNKSQSQRERALNAFRNGESKVLIATDIAARGIDVPGVSHVFNYEIPNVPEQYVHRIGRTARAGREGKAISFVSRDEKKYLLDIQRQIRMKIPIVDLPEGFIEQADEITENATPVIEERPRGRGGRDGGRGGRDGGRGGRDGGRGGRDGGRGGRDGGRGRSEGRGGRDGGGYRGRDDNRGDRQRDDRPQREDRPFRADANSEPRYEGRQDRFKRSEGGDRPDRSNRDDRFARRERSEGGRSEGRSESRRDNNRSEGRGGYQGNREGGRGEGRGGYQGRREGGRDEGRGGYQGRREGGRDEGRGGYQGRSEGGRGEGRGGYQGRSEGGRGEGRGGYQGRREGGRNEERGGYQGRRDDNRGGNDRNERSGPNREERLAGDRPQGRGYEGSNPRPRTNYDKTRAADGRSWGKDKKDGGRGSERTWNKKATNNSNNRFEEGAEGERSERKPPRGRSERPAYPSKGANRADGGDNGNRFKKRKPRSDDGPDFRRNDGGFSSPKKPGGGAKRGGPSDGKPRRKPSFAR